MIDHVSIPVRDLAASTAFYRRVLAPLGYALLVERPHTVGFGKRYPEFWLNARPDSPAMPEDSGHHVCLRAPSAGAVDDFHAAAIACGGTDAGAPGERRATMTSYFGAFVLDPDGNKIEAVAFPRPDDPAAPPPT
jgi:catechol 2,3-dioxygenase-like lactoylglutathione lyase family enzyme